jgi:hypothetical protein
MFLSAHELTRPAVLTPVLGNEYHDFSKLQDNEGVGLPEGRQGCTWRREKYTARSVSSQPYNHLGQLGEEHNPKTISMFGGL